MGKEGNVHYLATDVYDTTAYQWYISDLFWQSSILTKDTRNFSLHMSFEAHLVYFTWLYKAKEIIFSGINSAGE
jgi:hypothetical protein